jgi:hypothetical protein
LLDSFNGIGFGTQGLSGSNISYLTWHDTGGFVQISTLNFTAGIGSRTFYDPSLWLGLSRAGIPEKV